MNKSTITTITAAVLLGLAKSKLGSLGGKGREWTQEQIDLLGTMTDRDLAELLDISSEAVRNKRDRLKIDRFDWSRQWTQEQIDLLGKMSDLKLGELLGISGTTVARQREKLKIDKFKRGREWTQEQIDLIGTMPDARLAELLDLSTTAVVNKRKELKKKSYGERRRERKKLERQKKLLRQKQSRTVDLSLNPDLLQGQEFRTKSSSLLKGTSQIPSDAGNLPRYDKSGKRRLAPSRRDRGGRK